ncbi:ATP-binding response regulator [Zooshikella sp. RANM57]|uniref:ATP-binding response regulator n=1 Tax=Zooshikella sp. RANM57 TaxID=3425863 RepID=UPI003D6E1172
MTNKERNKHKKIPFYIFISIMVSLVNITSFLLFLNWGQPRLETAVESTLKTRNKNALDFFANNIRNDVLSGNEEGVNQKCHAFLLYDDSITKINILSTDGRKLCNLSKSLQSNSMVITSSIFFNEITPSPETTAATISVGFSTDIVKDIYAEYSSTIRNSLFFSITISTFFLIVVSCLSFNPINKLSAVFTHSDLSTISDHTIIPNLPNSWFRKIIKEVSILYEGSEILIRRMLEYQKEVVKTAQYRAVARTSQILAHDIRKPFSMLQGTLDVIDTLEDPWQAKEIANKAIPDIRRAIASVNGMIQDVMEVGTDSSLSTEESNLRALIENALIENLRYNEQANIAIFYQLYHTNKLKIDTLKVHRMFSNIIGNAIQAMNNEGKLWFYSEQINNFIKITIGNNNSYIPDEDRLRLFDAFFTKGKKGGTGLGLAIAKKIVEDHDGSIVCKSSQEIGTEFIFTLPIGENNELDAKHNLPASAYEIRQTRHTSSAYRHNRENSSEEYSLEQKIINSPINNKIKILVTDDEPLYRNIIRKHFSENSLLANKIELCFAASCQESVTLDKQYNFHIIIMDIDLGEDNVDGFDTVTKLRSEGSMAKIIIHSNRVTLDCSSKVHAVGAQGFLPKPLLKVHLLKIIDSLIKKNVV